MFESTKKPWAKPGGIHTWWKFLSDNSKISEWPKVDDEIEWGSGNIGIIKSLSDEFAWVKRSDNHQYTTIYASRIKKPKTPEEILIEELHQKLLANNCSDEYLLACDIVQGKIEGFSYNP